MDVRREAYQWADALQGVTRPIGRALAALAGLGVVAAVKEVGMHVPLVVRLEGTNVALGKEIIQKSGLNVISADDLDDAAQKIVKAVRGVA